MSIAKFSSILTIAQALSTNKQVLTGVGLATLLNQRGHRSTSGAPYVGGRGTYRLISLTYDWCIRNGNVSGAKLVAETFVNARGVPAWE